MMRCLIDAPGLFQDRFNCRITLEDEEESELLGFLLNYTQVENLPDEESEQEEEEEEEEEEDYTKELNYYEMVINRVAGIQDPMEIDQDMAINDSIINQQQQQQQGMQELGYGELDPEIWSGLPETVMEKVLMSLPLHILFKFSCVCRRWNSYMSEMSFRREYSVNNRQRQYYFLMVDHRVINTETLIGCSSAGNRASPNYSNTTETLIDQSNSNSTRNTVDVNRECLIFRAGMQRWLSLNRHSWRTEPYDVVAAAGGLICVKDRASGALCLHNPMTNTWRRLPPLIKPRHGRGGAHPEAHPTSAAGISARWTFEVGMWMHPNSRDYKIIVWTDGPAPFTQLFLSGGSRWELGGESGDGAGVIRGDPLSRCGAVSGSSFYMLVINEYLSVFAYSIPDDRWSELQAPMPEHILYGYLIDAGSCFTGDGNSCRCNLMMVGAIGEDFPMQGICVWRLSEDERSWVQVLRMPDSLYLKLTRGFRDYEAFKCAGKENQLCFLVDGRPRALMYDFNSALWWWSPNVAFRGQYQLISTQLRLDTQP